MKKYLSEMSSSLVSKESKKTKLYFYNRKEKSLGVLCTKFLSLYIRDDVQFIGLDDAALKLGVQHRRIYDIINIFESVGLMVRKARKLYSWKGFGEMKLTLEQLKKDGLKENFSISKSCESFNVLAHGDDKGSFSEKNDGQDNRRKSSLGLLTENFVKLFLCSNVDVITLDNAAVALIRDGHNSIAMKSQVRRLYDITNVLSTVNLIEKIHHPQIRKPAFKWLGVKGKPKTSSAAVSDLGECKKRAFGTEIANYSSKRSKVDSSSKGKPKLKKNMQPQMKQKDLENDCDRNKLGQHLNHNSAGFVFGPFTPVSVANLGDSSDKILRHWESMASSYCPLNLNQALSDLFIHYVEAWRSFNNEVVAEQKHYTD